VPSSDPNESQGRRLLLLREYKASAPVSTNDLPAGPFFLAAWPRWQRVLASATFPAHLDRDDPYATAQTLDAQAMTAIEEVCCVVWGYIDAKQVQGGGWE
jgi:hypothetical protein